MAEDNNNNGNNAINLVLEANRALRNYAVPLLQAKSWLNSLPNGFITTWEDLTQNFLTKFFSLANTTNMRNDITSFTQFDGQSLYEAWERFKELLRRCPHHGILDWLQVQTFYNELIGSIKTTIDVAAGGALISKNAADVYNLLEEMALNNYQWPSERLGPRKVVGAYEIDALGTLIAQVAAEVAALSKKFDTLGVHTVQNSFTVCKMCGDSHSSDQCSYNSASVHFVGNFNRQQNNPYSNTYNSGWRNHPNFSWNNNAGPSNPNPNMPPDFQQQAKLPILEKESQTEEFLLQYISKNDAIIQSYSASLRNLKTQVGQLANSINNRPQCALPSDT
ncbi:PREDICTED: uncharacterized protein LOC108660447 [Theobroma cacao]|uniref:Uncharacterized protein LOC108660447 n=1 Tax=Theobroma cacao TaxID=3641 RepID=A0AB32W0R6_THECC|nr:PREDICTED: uncharacterized protein LOC108660447 [Theobroma cacao]